MSKLEEMLKYVSEHNDFYKNRIQGYGIKNNLETNVGIEEFSIITREEFQKNNNNIISSEYRSKNYINSLYKLSSSGTSGVPVETLWDPSEYAISMLGLWRRRKKYYNISPNDKHIDFMLKYYNSLPDDKLKYSVTGNTVSVNRLNLGEPNVMQELILLINEFEPVWIQLAPSVMEMIINFCFINNTELPKSIKYVEFMSEILTPLIRKQTNELIPQAKISNMYGSEEMNAIAYECPFEKMHIISENVFAECFDGKKINSTGEGTVILTNLNNKVTPLIRYAQGDQVILEPELECKCGYKDKIIASLLGRKSSSALINGIPLTTCDVSDIMLIVSNKYGQPIKKYKFVYDTQQQLIFCYTLFNESFLSWKKEIWITIKKLFEEKYGEIEMLFELTDYDKNNYKHDLLTVK